MRNTLFALVAFISVLLTWPAQGQVSDEVLENWSRAAANCGGGDFIFGEIGLGDLVSDMSEEMQTNFARLGASEFQVFFLASEYWGGKRLARDIDFPFDDYRQTVETSEAGRKKVEAWVMHTYVECTTGDYHSPGTILYDGLGELGDE